MKRCSKCKQLHTLDSYAKLTRGKDGRRAQCKACDKKYRNSNKKPQMPAEDDEYTINSATMRNHLYLHFGFEDHRPNTSEYYNIKKYHKDSINIITTIKQAK